MALHRVVLVALVVAVSGCGGGGFGIDRVETLERAHHLYREPTLGTVVGDDLIYVAASQWQSFDAEGKLLVDQLVEPTILRLPLTD